MRSFTIGALAALTMSLYVGDASAGELPLGVRFRPGSACSDETAFARKLEARGVAVTPSHDPRSPREVEIDVRAAGERYEAEMVLRVPGEAIATRRVRAASCEEVRTMFAITLELALAALPPEPEAVASREPTAPAATPISSREGSSTTDAQSTAPATRATSTTSFGVGAGSRFLWGATPETATALGGFVELDLAHQRRIIAPRIRVGAFALLPPLSQPSGERQFALQAAELSICPVRFFETVVLRPCAQLDVGRLEGWREGPGEQRNRRALWAVIEVALSARWAPMKPLFVEIEAAVGPALTRPELVLGGATVSWRGPAVTGHTGASAGVLF